MGKPQLASFLIAAALLASAGLFAADETATHSLDEKEKDSILKAETKDSLITRQQSLIQTLKDLKIPRAPLERLAAFLDENPKASPEQFNRILENVAETMPNAFSAELKARLKKLYLDELGNVKVNPATEFVAAAKAVAGKLPVVSTPDNPPANPNNPNDPKNTLSTLSGATITPPARAESFPDISKLARSGEDAKGLKALEDKLAGLQEAFARQQLNPQGKEGGLGAAGQQEKGGLLSQILASLRKEGEGKDRGRGDDRGRRPPPEHTPAKAAPEPRDEPKETKRADSDNKRDRDRESDRDRRRGGNQPQQSNNEKSSGTKEDKKEDKDKDKKAEPLFADTPTEKKEKPKPAEEKAPETTLPDDSLADAANILTGKPKKVISLGQGSAGKAIQAQPVSASGPGPSPEGGGGGGGNEKGGGPVGPVVGGQGKGGDNLGEPPQATGEPAGGGGGGGPQSFNLIRMTEYTTGYGGDSGGDPAADPNANYDDAPTTQTRRATGPQMGSEPLRFAQATEVQRGWVLDLVGHWKKKICEGPDRGKVAVCFKVVGPGQPNQTAQGPLTAPATIRAGI